jgi:hypothetical protein
MSDNPNLPEVVRLAERMHAEKCDCGSSSEQDREQAASILAASESDDPGAPPHSEKHVAAIEARVRASDETPAPK